MVDRRNLQIGISQRFDAGESIPVPTWTRPQAGKPIPVQKWNSPQDGQVHHVAILRRHQLTALGVWLTALYSRVGERIHLLKSVTETTAFCARRVRLAVFIRDEVYGFVTRGLRSGDCKVDDASVELLTLNGHR